MWVIERADDAWGDDIQNVVCLPVSKYPKKQIKEKIKEANRNVKSEIDSRLLYEKVPIGTLSDIC